MDHNPTHRPRILAFIGTYQAAHGYPPSVREIADAVGIAAPSTVQWHLDALVADGRLARVPRQPRSLRVVPR